MSDYHIPVLLQETLNFLAITKGAKFVDCTLGGAGHTGGILARGGIVLAIDQDAEAIEHAKQIYQSEIIGSRLFLKHRNFAHLKQICDEANFKPVAGILFDLGVSSHQLETDYRGFSFNRDAALDMRMDPSAQAVTAADLINAAGEKELAGIFWRFGDEQRAKVIAKAIVAARKKGRISSTDQLAEIVLSVRKRGPGDRTHPATRIFQALRIAVNDELNSLESALPQALEVLSPGGKLVVISFHSLEDRIVKNFFKDNEDKLEILTDRPIDPTDEEVVANPRARSGKLRAAQKR